MEGGVSRLSALDADWTSDFLGIGVFRKSSPRLGAPLKWRIHFLGGLLFDFFLRNLLVPPRNAGRAKREVDSDLRRQA